MYRNLCTANIKLLELSCAIWHTKATQQAMKDTVVKGISFDHLEFLNMYLKNSTKAFFLHRTSITIWQGIEPATSCLTWHNAIATEPLWQIVALLCIWIGRHTQLFELTYIFKKCCRYCSHKFNSQCYSSLLSGDSAHMHRFYKVNIEDEVR